ncbi:sirohydrochlorin chelatase [Pirellulaceae bacterium SH449]
MSFLFRESQPLESSRTDEPHHSRDDAATQECDFPWLAKLTEKNIGVLVVGHGTRNPSGAGQLIQLTEEIQARLPGVSVEASFLELCEPDIASGLSQLRQRGCTELVVLPILLFSAAHAQDDIPQAVATSSEELGMRVLGQSEPLGTHPRVVELSRLRFDQVLRARSNCEPGHCSWGSEPSRRCFTTEGRTDRCRLGDWHESRRTDGSAIEGSGQSRIGLAMVGRGTSDPIARGRMKEITRLRVETSQVSWHQTGFFAGGEISVDQLLEEAAKGDCDTVVVQPHLLFEGELMNQLRGKILAMRERFPAKSWWLAGCLGADPSLADVFVGLLGERVERL